jgi:adenylate cyclase
MSAPAPNVDAWLRSRGLDDVAVSDAQRRSQLHLLVAAKHAVPDRAAFTFDDIARLSGIERDEVEHLWASFGFPAPASDGAPHFTQADVDAFKVLAEVRSAASIDLAQTSSLTRVIGSATSRVAEAAVSSAASNNRDQDPAERAEQLVRTGAVTMPGVAELLDYAWRRHLHATVTRGLAAADTGRAGAVPDLTVGFADLTGFTALSHQLSTAALEELVSRFAETVHSTVSRGGGRVVKMIGDEAMFVADDPEAGVRIGMELVANARSDRLLSELKVGLATGPVLARDGDYFGAAVNLASRITGITRPSAVVVTDEVRDAIGSDESIRWRNLRRCYLRNIGWVRLWAATSDISAPTGNPASRLISVLDDRLRESLEQLASLRGRVG